MKPTFAKIQETDVGQRYEVYDRNGRAIAWSVREDFAEAIVRRAGPGATFVDRAPGSHGVLLELRKDYT